MGKEFPLACREEEGQSMLLASTVNGESSTAPSTGDKRTQEPTPTEASTRGEAKDTKAKSKSSRKTKRANASSSEPARHRRDNKNRQPDRGDEGEDGRLRRSAQELGIVFPGNYCDDTKTVPHYWIETERVAKGSLFQCILCRRYLWLPQHYQDAEQLGELMRRYGKDEGYCRYLNRRREAKILVAKLQDLRRLDADITDKRKFAKLADKILSKKDYDRK